MQFTHTQLEQQLLKLNTLSELENDFAKLHRMIPSKECGYLTHNIHSYPATFLPHFPAIFIKHFSKKNDLILDPMCGAGTTLIEAALRERQAIGIEIDPIGHLISKVATTPIDNKELNVSSKELLTILRHNFKRIEYSSIELPDGKDYPNALLWFREDVLKELVLIRDTIKNNITLSKKYKNLALLALSCITKEVSNADPRDIFPERDQQNPVRDRQDVLAVYEKALIRTTEKIRRFSIASKWERRCDVIRGNACNLNSLVAKVRRFKKKGHIDLVITSPPYAYAIDYARVHQLSTLLFIMGGEGLRHLKREYVGSDRIGTKDFVVSNGRFPTYEGIEFVKNAIEEVYAKDKKCGVVLYKYLRDMFTITSEIYEVLKPGGFLVYVIGDSTIKKSIFTTSQVLKGICESSGFQFTKDFERPYFAYRMMRKRNVHSNTIKKDHFIVVQKPA